MESSRPGFASEALCGGFWRAAATPTTGGACAEQAWAVLQDLDNREKEGMALMAKGFARWMEGDLDGARPLWEASLTIALEVGGHIEAATKRLAAASVIFHQ